MLTNQRKHNILEKLAKSGGWKRVHRMLKSKNPEAHVEGERLSTKLVERARLKLKGPNKSELEVDQLLRGFPKRYRKSYRKGQLSLEEAISALAKGRQHPSFGRKVPTEKVIEGLKKYPS